MFIDLADERTQGWAESGFQGSDEASEAALELVSWLVSDNIPHSYDGVLAGASA